VVAARADRTLIIVARHDRLVDVERLKELIATLPDLQVFTDSDQGHGWNEAAVHRQLEVLKSFFGNCHGNGHAANGSHASMAPLSTNGGAGSALNGRPALLDTVTIPLSPA
jgi:hypothetical protein